MKKIVLSLFLASSLFSDVVEIKNFESDLFSKYKEGLQKIEFSLLMDGKDLKENRYKIVDALNIITSSFYIEELFTSKGKEKFKKVVIQYVTKKYSVDIDNIFIQKFRLKKSVGVEEFIKALKDEGYSKEIKSTPKQKFEEIEMDF